LPSCTPRHWVARVPRGCHSPYPLLWAPEGEVKAFGFGSPYIASGRTPQKTPLSAFLLLLRVHIRCQEDVFTEPLSSNCRLFRLLEPSNGCLFLFYNSGFEPPCHNILPAWAIGRPRFQRFSVTLSFVARGPSRNSCQMSNWFHSFKINFESEQVGGAFSVIPAEGLMSL
jgi:hypothetical protein